MYFSQKRKNKFKYKLQELCKMSKVVLATRTLAKSFTKGLICVHLDEVCVSWEYGIRDALYTACKTGDTEALHMLLKQDTCTLIRLLNTPIDSAGYTLLHVASAAAQKHAVKLLLEMGSDPSCR